MSDMYNYHRTERKVHSMDAWWSAQNCETENEILEDLKERILATESEARRALDSVVLYGFIKLENGKVVKTI